MNTMQRSNNILLMDGDVPQRTLRLASSYSHMIFVKNNNNEAHHIINIIKHPAELEARLLKDIDEFRNTDPNFEICVIFQSSKQAIRINKNLMQITPELNIKIRTKIRQRSDQ